MSLHDGSIEWKHISRDDFDRVVETLLLRIYDNPPTTTAVVLDGRGGDGGIDVGVYDSSGKIKQIFQLKHFPEGFSGGHSATRRKQIKKSFTTAWDNHKPPRWTVVVPCNPTAPESKYVTQLGSGKAVTCTTWGMRHLDERLSQPANRDILDVATRRPLIDALKEIGQEQAALAGPNDLQERIERLSNRVSGRSLHWDVDFAVSGNVFTQSFRQKHDRAAELEPLGFSFGLEAGAFGADEMQRIVDYGARRMTTIPGTALTNFKTLGPEWFSMEGPIDRLVIGPADTFPADQRPPVVVEFLDGDGFTHASHQGILYATSTGEKGTAFAATFYGILDLDIELPADQDRPGHFDLKMKFANAKISDAQGVLRILSDFASGAVVQIHFDGKKYLKGIATGDAQVIDAATELLVDDLSVLQDKLQAEFRLPPELTNRERVMIRVGRLLTEGKATFMPADTSLTGTLHGGLDEALELLLTEPTAITMPLPKFPLDVQGSRFNLGAVTFYHQRVAVKDAASVRNAFRDGTAAGRKIVFAPQGEKLVWVAPGFYQNATSVPETCFWELPGISMPSYLSEFEAPEPSQLEA